LSASERLAADATRWLFGFAGAGIGVVAGEADRPVFAFNLSQLALDRRA